MNDSPYGLTASVWTQDADRATRILEQLDAGTGKFASHNLHITQLQLSDCFSYRAVLVRLFSNMLMFVLFSLRCWFSFFFSSAFVCFLPCLVYMNRCDFLEPTLPWSGRKDSGKGVGLSSHGFSSFYRLKGYNMRVKTN